MLSILKAASRRVFLQNSQGLLAYTFRTIKENSEQHEGLGDFKEIHQGGFNNRGGYGKSNSFGNKDRLNSNGGYNKPYRNLSRNSFNQSSDDGDQKLSQNGYDESQLGENLKDIDFSQIKLPPFQKEFLKIETPLHSEETIEAYRKEKGILLKSKHAQVPQPFLTWAETKFPNYLMSIIEKNKFSDPMPIQAQSFPILMSGNDLIGIAQTGSGKTLSFLLPALIHINAQEPVKSGESPIVLVLAPTRELANQIQEQCFKFGSQSRISSVCIYGGAPKHYQENQLRRGCDIVIATPGRLIDFLENGVIDLKRVTYLVLDEADRMLDMGFEPSIRKILGQIRPDRQTLMFSATWPQQVRKLALDFCNTNPIHIQLGDMENNVNKDIEQIVEVISRKKKYDRLKEILQSMQKGEKALIFTQTKKYCDELNEILSIDGISNASIHGDKSQRERDRAMDQFKNGRISTLIATDVASRGLDVKDIKIVVNFDFPKQIEDYVHRVGRTGRAGAQGKAISFIDPHEDSKIVRDLVSILKQNEQVVSEELLDISNNGRSGSGFKRKYERSNKFQNNSYYGDRDGSYRNNSYGKSGSRNSRNFSNDDTNNFSDKDSSYRDNRSKNFTRSKEETD